MEEEEVWEEAHLMDRRLQEKRRPLRQEKTPEIPNPRRLVDRARNTSSRETIDGVGVGRRDWGGKGWRVEEMTGKISGATLHST